MSKPKEPQRPFNPRVRANVYALAALFLGFLAWKMFKAPLPEEEAPALPEEAEEED